MNWLLVYVLALQASAIDPDEDAVEASSVPEETTVEAWSLPEETAVEALKCSLLQTDLRRSAKSTSTGLHADEGQSLEQTSIMQSSLVPVGLPIPPKSKTVYFPVGYDGVQDSLHASQAVRDTSHSSQGYHKLAPAPNASFAMDQPDVPIKSTPPLGVKHNIDVTTIRLIYAAAVLCMVIVLLAVASKMPTTDEPALSKNEFPSSMPALASLRYFAVLFLWFNHEWIFLMQTSKFFLMLSGFVLHFAEERRSCAMHGWFGFVYRRCAKLYPLYALHIVVGFVGNFRPDCAGITPIKGLLVIPMWFEPLSCGSGSWFIPCIIGCYMIFPMLSPSLKELSFGITCGFACCLALLIALLQDFVAWRKTLVICLPLFVLGMVLARIWTFVSSAKNYGIFSQVTCSLFLFALPVALVEKYVSLNWGEIILMRIWVISWMCLMLMGFAGPCKSAKGLVCNPMLSFLSWEPLAFMGELALPIYMTNTMASFIVNHLFKDFGIPGFEFATLPEKHQWGLHFSGALTPWKLCCIASQFIVLHIIAWVCYVKCLAESSSKPTAEPSSTESMSKPAAEKLILQGCSISGP